eukprot:TRINITY_DN81434_c0_g1_i1.p1 TRINITY_DN81434_c0_g1~~TRINITY_DN81434_c0_g1_i1.p1  ORF type:complete len:313 (+),score=80.84 TRINITY_DN81434_c0_g1_i1:53-991(+)
MSCLPPDALAHFEQREQELLKRNAELDQKRIQAVDRAANAVQDAESSSSRVTFKALQGGELEDQQEDPQLLLQGPSAEAAPILLAAARAVPSRPSSSHGATDGGGEALHTTIRLQNARILALQEELDKTIQELAARDDETHQLRQESKQAAEEIKRLQKSSAAAEQGQDKNKKRLADLEVKCKELEVERSELIKERDQFDLKLRKLDAENSSKEARINRLVEEAEKLKASAKEAGHQDRDRASTDRREVDRLTSEIRKLERQRSELVTAFKKQMKLIEVLKRQRAHMEAARVLSFTEDEFIRILELGDKLGE